MAKENEWPVLARGDGTVTHNRASEPGALEITIWGRRSKWHLRRDVGVVLGEEDFKVLLKNLEMLGPVG
jgi:hypothetical protein